MMKKSLSISVFIQARLSSKRLPSKVLLKLGRHEIISICYHRAISMSYNLKVLTSIDKSDDALAEFLASNNIPFFRGDLDNVLKRFHDATASLKESDIIVRLTGDNVLPNSIFIEKLIDFYIKNECEYLTSSHANSKLPYGLSVEVFRRKHLTEAFNNASSIFDLEHVTPYIIRNYKVTHFKDSSISSKYENLRCTIDTADDYSLMKSVFHTIDNPFEEDINRILELVYKRTIN